jgi:leader peptidase (prepilin peptidase)/N-methyltransferase
MDRTLVIVVVAGAVGACVGSFLTVVTWRVPRHESIVRPPSHCPACDRPLRPLDLVPVLSWVGLRGRSRCCGTRISIRYPLLELGCAAVFAGAAALIT